MARQKERTKSASPENCSMNVAQKAYELWQKRGCPHGDDWSDWFEAEKIAKANKR